MYRFEYVCISDVNYVLTYICMYVGIGILRTYTHALVINARSDLLYNPEFIPMK